MTEQFWLINPYVLMNKKYIMNLFPNPENSLATNLNAITRVVILMTLIGFYFTRSLKLIVTSIVTLVIIVVMYKTKAKKETFSNQELYSMIKEELTTPTKQNPLMNVQMQEYQYNPKRKPAAPSFNPKIERNINQKVKEGLDERLFQDLGDNIEFEHSMRNFYTTANTQIPNDQKGFAEFCYGGMQSCKDGDGIQCVKNNYNWTNPSG
jgi:c-di-AMP phosphodiesterase-like protein